MLAARQNTQLSQAEIESIRAKERQLQWKVLERKKNKTVALRRDRAAMLASVLVIFALAFCYTFMETRIFNCGLEINRLNAEAAAIEKENDRQSLNVISLASLERIEPYARLNLGMVFPDQKDIAYVRYSGYVSVAALAQEEEVLPVVSDISTNPMDYVSPILQTLEQLFNDYLFNENR
ncbi:MAG: hypothetical protein FWE85_04315 [Clostridiales bacterium]|nr:hypothetical protein [Clostridiales bacterium]